MSNDLTIREWLRAAVSRRQTVHDEVSVCIPSYREGLMGAATVASAVGAGAGEVVYVDDHSRDGVVADLAQAISEEKLEAIVKVVPASTRGGVAGSRALAAAQATRPFLFHIDGHTAVTAAAIGDLATELREHPDTGIVAPSVRPIEWGVDEIAASADVPADVTELPPIRGWRLRHEDWTLETEHAYTPTRGMARQDVFVVRGGAWMCRAEEDSKPRLIGVGFWGAEDVDLCLRVHRRKQRVIVLTETYIGIVYADHFHGSPGHYPPEQSLIIAHTHLPDPAYAEVIFHHMQGGDRGTAAMIASCAGMDRDPMSLEEWQDLIGLYNGPPLPFTV